MNKHIIGLTGAFGSGKSTAAYYFERKGFTVLTLSSVLEDEAIKRKLPLTRKVLQDIGNELREKKGAGILIDIALRSVDTTKKIVIDGLRNIGEVEVLKKNKGELLAIVADKRVRYARLKNLKRREKLTWPLFNQLDLRDLGVNEKITGLQTAFCIALADNYIDSNSTPQEFERKLENYLLKNG